MLPIALLLVPLLQAQRNPFDNDPKAVDAGRQTYLGACSACHGASGQGGTGPNLITARNTSRMPDGQLFRSIRNGLPGTDMPPFPMAEERIWELVAFLRSLSAPAITARVPGDAAQGEAVFFGKGGCSACHRIAGKGGWIGPDLSNAGANRTLLQLRESVWEPNARIEDGFAAIRVLTTDGSRIAGVAKNENNYSLQVLDREGRLHLLSKHDVRELQRGEGSLMPAGIEQRLSKAEAESLLHFLSRQSIRPHLPPAKESR